MKFHMHSAYNFYRDEEIPYEDLLLKKYKALKSVKIYNRQYYTIELNTLEEFMALWNDLTKFTHDNSDWYGDLILAKENDEYSIIIYDNYVE